MNLRAGWPARVVALATVAYSVSITVAPKLLAKPCRMTESDGSVSPAVASLTRSIGVRDAALAAALAVAPAGFALQLLTAARVVSDGADAVWFGRLIDDRPTRIKVASVASGWALLEALAVLPGRAGKDAVSGKGGKLARS